MKTILTILIITLMCGCASTSTGNAPKSSAAEIAVFPIGSEPSQQFVVLGTLKDDATEKEEDDILEDFKKKARKMGGDAIVYRNKKQSGMEAGPFSFGKMDYTYLYTVDVIKFQ